MPGEKNKARPFETELNDLRSGKEEKAMNAIARLRESGNQETTTAIISLLLNEPSADLLNEIQNYLFDLRNEAAAEPLLDAISNPEYRDYKSMLISVFWQSAIDATDYIFSLISVLSEESSYIEIIEVLTVLENIDGNLNEDELFEAIASLNEYIYSTEKKENIALYQSMIEELNNH